MHRLGISCLSMPNSSVHCDPRISGCITVDKEDNDIASLGHS